MNQSSWSSLLNKISKVKKENPIPITPPPKYNTINIPNIDENDYNTFHGNVLIFIKKICNSINIAINIGKDSYDIKVGKRDTFNTFREYELLFREHINLTSIGYIQLENICKPHKINNEVSLNGDCVMISVKFSH